MNEFELIDAIVAELGAVSGGARVVLGPGDDAAVTTLDPGHDLVSSIDALMADVHFPATADPELVGYRALMVSLSDLAAMAAEPLMALVSVTLPHSDEAWLRGLARGMAAAAQEVGACIVGGNLARGALGVCVSVHGQVPAGQAITRAGARPGDGVYVTGSLGGAAAALARGGLGHARGVPDLDELATAYYRPKARIQEGMALRGVATSMIDLSDGLLQDLAHLCAASGVGASIAGARVPVAAWATLQQALAGGDDYELCFTASAQPPDLVAGVCRIGEITAEGGLKLDGATVDPTGYQHFES